MLVECQTCPVRNVHCADCMVTALSALPIVTRPAGAVRLDAAATSAASTPGRAGSPERGAADLVAGPDPGTVPLDRAERRAVSAFLVAGLISTSTANAARARVEAAPPARTATRRAV